jgi:hypothetical protein
MCDSNISNFAGKRKRPVQTDSIHLDPRFFDPPLTAKICLIRAKDQLNEKERDFLVNIRYIREPSPRQLAWLEAITKKANLDWRPT